MITFQPLIYSILVISTHFDKTIFGTLPSTVYNRVTRPLISIVYMEKIMTEKTNGNKENPTKCESVTCCKATASLEKSVAEDLKKDDKTLEDLLNDDDKDPTLGG